MWFGILADTRALSFSSMIMGIICKILLISSLGVHGAIVHYRRPNISFSLSLCVCVCVFPAATKPHAITWRSGAATKEMDLNQPQYAAVKVKIAICLPPPPCFPAPPLLPYLTPPSSPSLSESMEVLKCYTSVFFLSPPASSAPSAHSQAFLVAFSSHSIFL